MVSGFLVEFRTADGLGLSTIESILALIVNFYLFAIEGQSNDVSASAQLYVRLCVDEDWLNSIF